MILDSRLATRDKKYGTIPDGGIMLEIVLGPARAGKGEKALERFCREVGEGREARALWLVPHRNLARLLRRKVAERLGAVADPKILTLDDLARWVFETSPGGLKILSEISRLLQLSELLEKSGNPGLARHLAGAVDDLKEHRLWPKGAPAQFARDYDRMLRDRGVVDRKSMASKAVQRLRESKEFFAAARTNCVLFYGFTSFSPLEWELVQAILKHLPGWISLDADPARPELFAESLTTCRQVESLFKVKSKEVISPTSHESRVTSHEPRATQSIRLLAFSTYDSELEWIACETLRLCREEKYSPDEIAVVSGAGSGCVGWARQIFRRYGLPLQSFCAETLESQPILRRPPGEISALMSLPEEEAQLHLAALEQWEVAQREIEGHPLYAKYGALSLRHQRFLPPRLHIPAVHFYGAEAPPLESYRAVFVSHLLENSFPRPVPWNLFEASPLVDAEEHRRRERLAFYRLLTRADEKLVLCVSRKDFQGDEVLPSLFLKEWELFFPGESLPQPEPIGYLTPLLDRAPRAQIEPEMNDFFERKNAARLESPEILAQLRQRLEEGGSITQMENFGKCRFLHFAQNGMRLQEVEVGVPPKVLGQIAHEVLAQLGPRILDEEEAALLEEMKKLARRSFEKCGLRVSAAQLELEERILERKLAAFLRGERSRLQESGARPRYFEQWFGREGVPPYRMSVDGGLELALRGRIDRIDVHPDGKTADVIDYKTGEPPAPKEMREGRSLQLQCYLDVCEKVFDLKPVQGLYLSIKGKKGQIKEKDLSERIGETREFLRRYAAEMLTGTILAKAEPQICEVCVYRTICRTDEK